MPDVEITVRGTASATHPPERATAHVAAAVQGSDRGQVHRQASETAQAITATIAPLVDAENGPITRWSSEQINVHTYREYDDRKRVGQLMHQAQVQFQVRFACGGDAAADFTALSSWLGSVVVIEGVEVRHVEWSLTRALREQLMARARDDAVRDAQERAAAYARSLGLQTVRPVALADPGLLGAGRPSGHGAEQEPARAFSLAGGRMDVEFVPQDIEVRAAVDARFMAG